ncbi:MAG: hypothetical protein QXK86_04000 [Candidatus Bathyarchaeia archaeon]
MSLAHLIDALNALLFNNPIVLLRLYPFTADKIKAITPENYFITFAFATLMLWGLTCIIAFENPVERFMNRVLSEAKKQSTVESQLLEQKSEVLDAMSETIEENNKLLAHVRDVLYNVRAEAKEIQPIKEFVEKIKLEINDLKREIKKLEGKINFPVICMNCGKPILPEFKMCPYCGENIKSAKEESFQQSSNNVNIISHEQIYNKTAENRN